MSDIHDNGNVHEVTEAEVMVEETFDPSDAEGMRLENYVSPRTFVDVKDIVPLLAAVPVGQPVGIGHIAGFVTSYERRESSLPVKPGEKVPPASIWLRGVFDATSYQTGEITRATWAILPRVMGELIAEAMDNNEGEAVLDIELGVAATGKTIPYRYTVTTYRATRQQAALAAIRTRHMRRVKERRAAEVIEAEKAASRLVAPAPRKTK